MDPWIVVVVVAVVAVIGAFLLLRRQPTAEPPQRPDPWAEASDAMRARAARVASQPNENISDEMRRIAPLVARAVQGVGSGLQDGTSTSEIAAEVIGALHESNLSPAMAGYNGFPADVAVSINEEVVHGIPSDRSVRNGDLVTIEASAATDCAFASHGWTFVVGEHVEDPPLLSAAKRALHDAIDQVREGKRLGDVSAAIQSRIESEGFSVVRDYVGYGMGRRRIEAPPVACFGAPDAGPLIRPKWTLHLHVIATAGSGVVTMGDDGWSVREPDGAPSCLVTAMVRLGEDHADVLTPISGFDPAS